MLKALAINAWCASILVKAAIPMAVVLTVRSHIPLNKVLRLRVVSFVLILIASLVLMLMSVLVLYVSQGLVYLKEPALL